jgi:hypothetical protein
MLLFELQSQEGILQTSNLRPDRLANYSLHLTAYRAAIWTLFGVG